MNLALDERYQAIFLLRGELTLWLYSLTRDILSASRDVVFIDFGTTYWLPLPVFYIVDVGDKVILPRHISLVAVVISHMFYRDSDISLYRLDDEFNTRVFLYLKYIHVRRHHISWHKYNFGPITGDGCCRTGRSIF